MSVSQIVFGSLLVLVLVGLSLFYGARQLTQLRRLREQEMADDEQQYERAKAWRRLLSSGLIMLLAVLLVVLLVWYEPGAQRIADEFQDYDRESAPAFTPEQTTFLRVWTGIVVAFLLVLLAVVLLAGVDLWSTRRFALRQYKRLQADRRAMIQRQSTRLRQDRDGPGERGESAF